MEKLYISPEKTTPEINFDPKMGILSVSGESYPENSAAFYAPVFDWLYNYLSTKPEFEFYFKMVYFNTSSSKAILDIIDILEKYHENNGKVKLIWYHDEDDEDIMESGEEFTEKLNMPCEIRMKKE